jgi:protein involved in polysaccharide export with SLBB domain
MSLDVLVHRAEPLAALRPPRRPRRMLAGALVGLGLAVMAGADPPRVPSDPMIATIKPRPLPPIPDDPSPHEGALFELPYTIDSPDLLLIEVLEALPGRPIGGEKLVRPDGSVSLGFYGEVHVRGLTIAQAKEKIVRHLRSFLIDEVLGLKDQVNDYTIKPMPGDTPPAEAKPGEPDQLPEIPKGPLPLPPQEAPRTKSAKAGRGRMKVRRASQSADPEGDPKTFTAPPPKVEAQPPAASTTVTPEVQLPSGGSVRITIEVQDSSKATPPEPADVMDFDDGTWIDIHPIHSDRVFVDVTGYNSKFYYIEGGVAEPGKIPWTGNETALDALQYAGGFINTADPRNVRLIRPGRGGAPAKVYRIDLEAIRERGEKEKNYQIFPGDRIIVGRDAVVKSTLAIDRLAAPLQTVFNSIIHHADAARALKGQASTAAPAGSEPLTPSQREAIVNAWIDVMRKAGSGEVGEADEKTLREALLWTLLPAGGDESAAGKK